MRCRWFGGATCWLVGMVVCGGAEPMNLPTTPQVPPVQLIGGSAMRAAQAPAVGRVHVPVTERKRAAGDESAASWGTPSTWPATTAESPMSSSGVRSLIPGSPVKSWLLFHPTTGHALPWLRPQPFVGPVTGTFPCTAAGSVVVDGVGDGCCAKPRQWRAVGKSASFVAEGTGSKAVPSSSSLLAPPPGYRFAVSVYPKLYDQLLQPVETPRYTPVQTGFWNTPNSQMTPSSQTTQPHASERR
jgi:hypothetical protein